MRRAMKPRFSLRHLALAWLAATVLSGAPSTLYAWAIGDLREATFAAERMLVARRPRRHAVGAAAPGTLLVFSAHRFTWDRWARQVGKAM